MATIELSPAFATAYAQRMLSVNTVNMIPTTGYTVYAHSTLGGLFGYGNTNPANYNGANGYLYLMKGTKPANFSTLTNFASRSADVLAVFNPTQLTSAQVNSTITLSSTYSNATATGTCTWFWIVVKTQNNYSPYQDVDGNVTNLDLINQVMGTVGLLGSGADLEMQSVSLVTGTPARILNFGLSFPTTWTY